MAFSSRLFGRGRTPAEDDKRLDNQSIEGGHVPEKTDKVALDFLFGPKKNMRAWVPKGLADESDATPMSGFQNLSQSSFTARISEQKKKSEREV